MSRYINVVGAVLLRGGKILAAQRGEGRALAGMWEFPGGKIEAGETPEQALQRELKEELRIDAIIDDFIETTKHSYDFGTVVLTTYYATITNGGDPELTEHAQIRWCTPAELKELEWAPADVPVVNKISAKTGESQAYKYNVSQPSNGRSLEDHAPGTTGGDTSGITFSRTPIGRDIAFGFLDQTLASDKVFHPALIMNSDDNTMLAAIRHELRRSHSFQFFVAFIATSALAHLKQDLLDYKGEGTIYTSTYLDFNEPGMFEELLGLPNISIRVLKNEADAFHSKGYIFEQEAGTTAIIGSSNLTAGALIDNKEWNLRFSALPGGDIVDQLSSEIDSLFRKSEPLTHEWIERYEQNRHPKITINDLLEDPTPTPAGPIAPNAMQQEALEKIKEVQDHGEHRALVISATGTGKTILAALAARQANPNRMLFIVHREQILDKAMQEFQRVLEKPARLFGKLAGSTKQLDRKYVFATVQSLSRRSTLQSIDPEDFDLVIVDEVHRAGPAKGQYETVLEYLKPAFMLGLTATPERMDGRDIYKLFDYNVPYEIRLQQALENKMLAPFNYYGVHDFIDAEGKKDFDPSKLAQLVADERVTHIIRMLEIYGYKRGVKGLMFCSSIAEAQQLSKLFNKASVNGRPLHTLVLTGEDDPTTREDAVEQLEAGQLDYILTIDIFNEGIDIPSVNQVVMLRPTKSSIIFTQQLGRGLRTAPGKSHLRVIDFIGNYQNDYLIPIALFGDKSLSKDSVRRRMIEALKHGTIAGLSSVSFDQISQERIFRSLFKANLANMWDLKKMYKELEDRLDRQPMRIDFATTDDLVHPVIIATSPNGVNNYAEFLGQVFPHELPLTPIQNKYVTLLDNEFLNGERPHELLVLRHLLAHESMTVSELREELDAWAGDLQDLVADELTVNSLKRILNLEWFTQNERTKYGNQPFASFNEEEQRFVADENLKREYEESEAFRAHVDDVIKTGLYLNRAEYHCAGRLLREKCYSRKDVCRLMNWDTNKSATIYGYKVDDARRTCPIFVTYHKNEDITETTKYEDAFDDPATLHWFTKASRTLKKGSQEANIAAGLYTLHIFVKKDDAEGQDFYYLGTAKAHDAVETTMPTKSGPKSVVSMRLDLEKPVTTAI